MSTEILRTLNDPISVYIQSEPPVKLVVCTSPKRAYYRSGSQDALNIPPVALLALRLLK